MGSRCIQPFPRVLPALWFCGLLPSPQGDVFCSSHCWRALKGLHREFMESPSLGVFKPHLGTILMSPPVVLPTNSRTVLEFCDNTFIFFLRWHLHQRAFGCDLCIAW